MRIARVSVPGVEFPVYGVITGEKIEILTQGNTVQITLQSIF